MIYASNRFALWICALLFFAGCLSAEARTAHSPPQKSILRELARIQTKSPLERDPTLTQDGAYYADSDGIHKIDFSGLSKLFISWSQIPDFWKTWQESVHSAYSSGSPTLPSITKMADESLVIGDVSHLVGSSKSTINLQHISRTGTPLRHFQYTLSGEGYYLPRISGLEKSRVLMNVYNGYSSLESDIIDIKAGTLVALEQAFGYESPKYISAVDGQVFAIFNIFNDHSRSVELWTVTWDLSGKIIEKEKLSDLVSLRSSEYELELGSIESLGPGMIGLWIYQFEDSRKDSCNFYAFDGNRFSRLDLHLLYREETVEDFKCKGKDYIWLGEGNVARWDLAEQTRQKAITVGKPANQDAAQDNTMILDWRYDWGNAQRTEDGSLVLLGISNLSEDYPKLRLINPDGQDRLTYTFDFKLLSPSKWTPTYTEPTLKLYGPYMTLRMKNEVRMYKIENAPN